MQPLAHFLRFNSEILTTFLDNLDGTEATDTLWPNQKRSPASLVAHLLASRGRLLAWSWGEEHPLVEALQTWGQAPARHRRSDPEPSVDVEALRSAWTECARALEKAQIGAELPSGVTGKEEKEMGFLVWHEIYHIGQLGLLRDVSRGPASMRQCIYDVRANLEGSPS